MRQNKPHNSRVSGFFLTILFLASGCAHLTGSITYYDPTTYKNLTDLKPEVIMLYESFTSDSLDTQGIAAVRLKLAQIYEYEKGKGPKNSETAKQVKIIQEIFELRVKDRIENGKWNQTNLQNATQNITEAFDIAIHTESLKNKSER